MPSLSRRLVVATGRFQTLHLGSLAYLRVAQKLAATSGAEFFVSTGPLDNELGEHGLRTGSGAASRLFSFSERQLLISTALSMPSEFVVNNRSSPHHGEPGLTIWTRAFFDPVNQALRRLEMGSDVARFEVTLAVVKKKEDFKVYRSGDAEKHYADYLLEEYPKLTVVDLAAELKGAASGNVSSSGMPWAIDERALQMPAIMQAAEILRGKGHVLTELACVETLKRINELFGRDDAPSADVLRKVSLIVHGEN